MTQQDLIEGGSQPMTANANPLQMVQTALEKGLDADTISKFMDLADRHEAKQAKADFNAAMSAIQRETGRISADATNPQTRSKYASYAALDRVLRPIYTKHGLSLSFDEGEPCEGAVEVLCYVSHSTGHTRTYKKRVPLSDKGIKGNQMMTPTHANASGDSYGMRYLVKKIFNIAVGEDDDDGNMAGVPESDLIDERTQADINSLVDEVLKTPKERTAFSGWLKSDMKVPNGFVRNIPQSKVEEVVKMLNKKKAKQS